MTLPPGRSRGPGNRHGAWPTENSARCKFGGSTKRARGEPSYFDSEEALLGIRSLHGDTRDEPVEIRATDVEPGEVAIEDNERA